MKASLLLSALTLVLAFQKTEADDKDRVLLLDEAKERLHRDFPVELEDEATVSALDSVLLNAFQQPKDTATAGAVPEIDPNPLGLSPEGRQMRHRERESHPGVIRGNAVAAVVDERPAAVEEADPKVPAGPFMRAKLKVSSVGKVEHGSQAVGMSAVGSDEYGENGESEDNTFAKYTPQADLSLTLANPALLDTLQEGDMFYVDFTPVPAPKVEEK